MKNAETHSVKLKTVMASKPFLDGFKDYAIGNGWHEPGNEKEQWRYERGRLFAAFLKSYGVDVCKYRLKAGRYATLQAVDHYKLAKNCGAVI